MLSRPIYPYIAFGASLRYLQDAQQGYRLSGNGHIISNIEKILKKLEQLSLPVSKRAVPTRELVRFKEQLIQKPEGATLDAEEASDLNRIITELRIVIEAETSGSFAFIVTEKRIDVQKLLSDVKSLMPVGVFEQQTDEIKYDLEQSGKCLAFELPTASAFHIIRATEGALRFYYCSIVRQNRVEPMLWGPMTTGLRSRRVPPPETILALLDHIRKSFRNPTQHPEMIYGMDEAQNLFGLCIDAISRMHDHTLRK